MKKLLQNLSDRLGVSPTELLLSCVCVLLAGGYFGLSYLFIVILH